MQAAPLNITLELIGGPMDGNLKVIPLGQFDVLAPGALIHIRVVVGDAPLRMECYKRRGVEMVADYIGEGYDEC